jgi:hypothetical protein
MYFLIFSNNIMMNRILILSFSLLLAFSITTKTFAQKSMSKGVITYNLATDAEDEMISSVLSTAVLKVYMSDNLNKVDASIMSGMMSANLIIDNKAKKGLVLVNAPQGKQAITISPEEYDSVFENADVEAKGKLDKAKETKKIAGYTCNLFSKTGDDNMSVKFYTSSKIKSKNKTFNDFLVDAMGGFPLGMEATTPMGKIMIEAEEVSTTAPKKSIFDMTIPEGYEVMTMTEAKEKSEEASENGSPQGIPGMGF